MKFGWPISLIGHGLLGVTLLVGFSSIRGLEPQQKIIQVHLANIDEITNVRASIERPKSDPVPAEEPMALQNPMENAPDEGDPEERSVEPEPEPELAPDSDKEAEITAQDPKPSEPTFDLDRISQIVDKSRDQQPEAGQQQVLLSEQNFIVYSTAAQAAVGEGTALTLSEMDALRQRMYECWRIPVDAVNPHELIVEVRVHMRSDGSVSDAYLESPGKVRRSPNPFMQKAARNAVNAVKRCSPYDFLPAEKYASWQDMVLRFIPPEV